MTALGEVRTRRRAYDDTNDNLDYLDSAREPRRAVMETEMGGDRAPTETETRRLGRAVTE